MPAPTTTNPPVAIIMGSRSDWPVLQHATTVLDEMGIAYKARVVSAHRTPQRLFTFASNAAQQGFKLIIAGAGGAAHLPGMAASLTTLPVIAVPIPSHHLNGLDSLLSIVQMPRGIAVATQAIGEAGAFNAGVLAAQMLAMHDTGLAQRFVQWRARQTEAVSEEVQ